MAQTLYFESLLDIKDPEEFAKDDEFNLKTTFAEENHKDSKEILLKHSIFDRARMSGTLKPVREPKLLKRIRKEIREKTLGDQWGDMRKQDPTPEFQSDLAVLQLRRFLNPKSFFKSSENNKNLPKYYQVGTILEGGEDFVGGRLRKKERKNNLIDLFLKEDGELKFSRKRFLEIQKEKQRKSRNRKGSKFNKLKRLGKKMLKKR